MVNVITINMEEKHLYVILTYTITIFFLLFSKIIIGTLKITQCLMKFAVCEIFLTM